MVTYILWSAVAWTFKGLLCTWRFFWVSPYCAIKERPFESGASDQQFKQTTGSEKREKPGRHECSSAVHKRLSKAEEEIQALKSQIASERVSWERRFMELQRRQQDLRDQLTSETLARTGVFLGESGLDYPSEILIESEVENGHHFQEKEQDCSNGMILPLQLRGPDMMSSKGDAYPSSLTGSQVSYSAFGSRPTSATSAYTSVGSWRSGSGPHRVFVPHSPLDLQIGHRVRVLLPSGRISTGTLRYLGPLEGLPDFHLGVELESAEHGLHNGTHEGQCYFECKPGHGAFVAFSKLLMTWE